MFANLTKGSLVLAPHCVHGGRRDKVPVIFYIKDRIEQVEPTRVKVSGQWYGRRTGTPQGGLRTLPLKSFVFTEDETDAKDSYLAMMQDRNTVQECLLDDDIVDKLDRNQLLRILNILDLDNSRRYREQ